MPRRHLKALLLLMGAFAFGYNMATFLHELGHALAAWAIGGTVQRIVVHPFSWSSTLYETVPSHPLLVHSAGVIFAVLVGVLLLVLRWSWYNPWAELLSLTAICAIIDNGIYLIVDSTLGAGGDGTSLLAMGLPWALVAGLGVMLALAGGVIAAVLVPRLGLEPSDGIPARLLILEGAIGPYLLVMIAYHWLSNRDEILLWLVYVAIGLAMLAGAAAASRFLQTRLPWLRRQRTVQPTWPAATASLILGLAAILFGLLTAGD